MARLRAFGVLVIGVGLVIGSVVTVTSSLSDIGVPVSIFVIIVGIGLVIAEWFR